MKRSRLASTTPAHTITNTSRDEASAQRRSGGVVKGGGWGWTWRTLAALIGGAAAAALFALNTLRHRNPLIDRTLFRLLAFTGASAVGTPAVLVGDGAP